MKKLLLAGASGVALGLVVTTQVAGPLIAQEAGQDVSVYEQLDLFGDIFERIRTDYVEEVDEAALIEAAINGMLTSLDPHSGYMSAEAALDMLERTSGEFGGLGLEVTQEEGWVKVITPIDGTPAQAAGMQPGDFITAVDGESLLGLTLEEATEMMRGPVGSETVITVVRDGATEPMDVSIIRDTIQVTAVRARTEGEAIILRVTTFSDQTFPDLTEGLATQIEAAGGLDNVNGIIIDLRNNAGGLLNQAIYVSDAFLEAGEIVSTRGRDPSESDRYNATPGDLAMGMPIVVLINEGTASASEIVAGALQDHRRAIVVGMQSFGKGSVQTLMPLQGEAAMRLTTARYYTPSGRSIQALGISPDIIVQQPPPPPLDAEGVTEETPRYTTEADLRGALDNDSLTEEERALLEADRARAEETAALREEDYQLAYAIDILRGLSVIGPSAIAVPVPVAAGE